MSKARAWYGPGGAIVTDKPINGAHELMSEGDQKYYGGKYMVGESIQKSVAITICKAMNLKFCGDTPESGWEL